MYIKHTCDTSIDIWAHWTGWYPPSSSTTNKRIKVFKGCGLTIVKKRSATWISKKSAEYIFFSPEDSPEYIFYSCIKSSWLSSSFPTAQLTRIMYSFIRVYLVMTRETQEKPNRLFKKKTDDDTHCQWPRKRVFLFLCPSLNSIFTAVNSERESVRHHIILRSPRLPILFLCCNHNVN